MLHKLTLILFIVTLVSSAHAAGALRLCYFSLNNDQEFTRLKKFLDIHRKENSSKIVVEEFLPYGEYADAGFVDLLNSNKHCNGLVLSGHHREPGFEGTRSPSQLLVTELEKWSCNPAFQSWFQNLKAVWLQGCATSKRMDNSKAELAHRYAKIFPNAAIFSWSGSAPSKMAPATIPFQIQNVAKLENISEKDLQDVAVQILEGSHVESNKAAWLGLRAGDSHELKGIFNRGAQTFSPYFSDPNNRMNYQLNCSLQNNSLASTRIAALEKILIDPNLLLANMELVENEYKIAESYPAYFSTIKRIVLDRLQMQMDKIISSNQWGILPKVELYQIFIKSGAPRNAKWEHYLRNQALFELNRPRKTYDSVEIRHIYQRLIAKLLKEFTPGKILLEEKDLTQMTNPDAMLAILKSLLQTRPKNNDAILATLMENPHANSDVLQELRWQINIANSYNKQFLLKKMAKYHASYMR